MIAPIYDWFKRSGWFWLLVLVLIAQRFFHFGSEIDSPHAWRQCDTAQYAWSFYSEGFDLLHPSVCWMGGHKTLILECPIPEALVALGYSIFGPSHRVARVVFFAFFLGCVFFFFRILNKLSTLRIARLSTLILLALPLSLFYSRAIHIDFSALFFAFGMAWCFLLGIERESWKMMVVGTLFAVPAFLIKAPYAFYLALPLLGWTLAHKKLLFTVKTIPLLMLPLLLFGLWIWHTYSTNATAPDWSFIPGYHNFTDRAGWYFGRFSMRLMGELWLVLGERFAKEVAGWAGLSVFVLGLSLGMTTKGYKFAALWLLGTMCYVLIFFNLNFVHNYYQIPLLAPTAFLMGIGIDWLYQLLSRRSTLISTLMATLLLLGVIGLNLFFAETHYYKKQPDHIKIGKAIQEHTPENALVVVSWGGLDSHCPLILYPARRYGWSIPERDLSGHLCHQLFLNGANYLATVRYSEHEGEIRNFTNIFPDRKVIPVNSEGLKVFLYHMEPEYLQPPE